MNRTSSSTPRATRASGSVREALEGLSPDAAERESLLSAVERALSGRGRARRDAERRLLQHRHITPERMIPLILAMRDRMRRRKVTPRGLEGRADALLRDIAARAPRRGDGQSTRRATPGKSGRRRTARQSLPQAHGPATGAGRVLRTLLELSPDAVLTVRASGSVGLWNRGASAILGCRRRDLGRALARDLFVRPEQLDDALEAIDRQGAVEPHEVRLRGTGEEGVPARLHGSRLALPARGRRDPERYLLVLHDVTEVHRIRSRLIETEKLSAMAKIAGSVAHEFRNPLNSLFLSTDLLEDELAGSGAPEAAIAPTLTAIREEIERLNQIINHYLSLSKVASNAPEVVDLGAVVEEFASDWEERAAEHGVELRVRVHDGNPSVSADPNQVRRVLVNLVENAFDALGGGGGEDDPPRGGAVTLAVRPMRRTVKLTVRDNGPGIPEDLRDKVFEPFFTSKSRGSGLGLYLVREIVLSHGGAISLGSTGGRGTSVATHWPRPEDRAA